MLNQPCVSSRRAIAAGVDLDAAAAADEDHDRRLVRGRRFQRAAQRRAVGSSRANSSPTRRSACTRPTLSLPSMPKNSCVSRMLRHAVRRPSTSISPSGRSTGSAARGASARAGGSAARVTRDQRIEGGAVGLVGGVDLVHGVAGGVEELQAEALAALQRLAHGEAQLPLAEEQAQVDVGAEHQPVRAGHLHVLEAAVALVHAVARCASGTSRGRRRASRSGSRASRRRAAWRCGRCRGPTSSASLTPSDAAASRMRNAGFSPRSWLQRAARSVLVASMEFPLSSTQMKTDGNLDPGGDGAAFAHRRKELPAAYGGERGLVQHLVAGAAP